MTRIEISLTDQQAAALKQLARRRKISLKRLVRDRVVSLVPPPRAPVDEEIRRRAMAISGKFRSGLGDLSKRHDDYASARQGLNSCLKDSPTSPSGPLSEGDQ